MQQTIEIELDHDHQELHDALEGDDRDLTNVVEDLLDLYVLQQKSIDTYTSFGGGNTEERSFGGVELINEIPPPMAVLLGFESVEITPGYSVIEFQPSSKHMNPMGTLHGGIICDLGDAAMASAYASTLEPSEVFATLELDSKFLKPVTDQHLVAHAEVIKNGRTTGLIECEIRTKDGDELVAYLNSTCLKLNQ